MSDSNNSNPVASSLPHDSAISLAATSVPLVPGLSVTSGDATSTLHTSELHETPQPAATTALAETAAGARSAETLSSSLPGVASPALPELPQPAATAPLAETAATVRAHETIAPSLRSSGLAAEEQSTPTDNGNSSAEYSGPGYSQPGYSQAGVGAPPPGEGPPPGAPPQPAGPPRPPYPFTRLFFSIFFAVLAWIVFWAVLLLGALQFVAIAISGHQNEELKGINRKTVTYLGELLSYIVFAREELPFPFQQHPHPPA